MGHALLISSDPIINDLYMLNFSAFLNTPLTVKNSFAAAISLLQQDLHLDFIICNSIVNGEKLNDKISELLESTNKFPALIIAGGNKKMIEGREGLFHLIENEYDIKALLKEASMQTHLPPTYACTQAWPPKQFLRSPNSLTYTTPITT